ncbi:MAG: SsgA family sporulation/cell division regulator [Pseudonocardia sp.]
MRDEHTVICSPAVFELIAPDAPVVPVNVELTYSSRDPYAVQASFRTGSTTAVEWVFARDLLHDGLIGPAGTGDVRVQPMPLNPGQVQLELSSPSGHAVFTTCAQALGEFLHRTYLAVPPDTEYSWLDFDVALSDLLNDPARD